MELVIFLLDLSSLSVLSPTFSSVVVWLVGWLVRIVGESCYVLVPRYTHQGDIAVNLLSFTRAFTHSLLLLSPYFHSRPQLPFSPFSSVTASQMHIISRIRHKSESYCFALEKAQEKAQEKVGAWNVGKYFPQLRSYKPLNQIDGNCFTFHQFRRGKRKWEGESGRKFRRVVQNRVQSV